MFGADQYRVYWQYNALIGGRGTGKSTILEYLRWGLCDQLPATVDDDELPNYQVRRKSLIEKTLQAVNGTVQVSFTVNGIPHVVRRNSVTDDLQLKVGTGDFAQCTEGDIRSLLPIQAYSQKQLSNVSVRLEELTRFVEAPVRTSLGDFEKSFERAAAEIRQLYATQLRKRRLQRQLANDELLVKSLNEQAENIRKSLKGLSAADTKLLSEKASYDRAGEIVEVFVSDVGASGDAIGVLAAALSQLPTDVQATVDQLPEGATLSELQKEISAHIAAVKKMAGDLKRQQAAIMSEDGALKGKPAVLAAKWSKASADFKSRYADAKKRASAHETQLKQLADMEKRITELRNTIARTRREVSGLGNPEAQYAQVRESWNKIKTDRATLIRQECANLTTKSQGEIRATVRSGAGVEQALQKFRSSVSGSGLRREKIDGLGEAIKSAANPDEKWNEVLLSLKRCRVTTRKRAGRRTFQSARC